MFLSNLDVFFKYLVLAVLGLECCAGSSSLHEAFSRQNEWRLLSGCSAWAPHCVGFLRCGSRALECGGFCGFSTQAYLPRGMWNLSGPGIEPMSPALQGRLLTTGPPGKPLSYRFLNAEYTVMFCNIMYPLLFCKCGAVFWFLVTCSI